MEKNAGMEECDKRSNAARQIDLPLDFGKPCRCLVCRCLPDRREKKVSSLVADTETFYPSFFPMKMRETCGEEETGFYPSQVLGDDLETVERNNLRVQEDSITQSGCSFLGVCRRSFLRRDRAGALGRVSGVLGRDNWGFMHHA